MEGCVIAIGKPQKAFVFLEECITAFLVCSGLSPCCSFDRWQMMAAGNKGPLFVLRNIAQEGRTLAGWNISMGLEAGRSYSRIR